MTPAVLTAAFVNEVDAISRRNCQGGGEVEMIARLFRSPAAIREWRKALNDLFLPQGVRASYNTVFCHGRPYVTFRRPRRSTDSKCELADALIVINDHTRQERRALLLQAKRGKKWPPNMRHHQWHLYSNWPQFVYSLSGTKQHRSLGAGTWGEYLLVTVATPPDICVPAAASTPRSFSGAMGQLVYGPPGHNFANDINTTAAPTDWDSLIWDLLFSTGAEPLPLYGRPKIAGSRGNRVTMMAHQRRQTDLWKGFGGMGPAASVQDEDNYDGFTVVIINLEGNEQ